MAQPGRAGGHAAHVVMVSRSATSTSASSSGSPTTGGAGAQRPAQDASEHRPGRRAISDGAWPARQVVVRCAAEFTRC
jgi:hypothetical protein